MRMWEIRENAGRYDYDKSSPKTLKEAYECGYEEGYKDAMEEFEEKEDESISSYRMPSYRKRYK